MSNLTNNTEKLQNLLTKINELPNAGTDSMILPTLTNQGSESDLRSDKQLIDSDGNIVNGNVATRDNSHVMFKANGENIEVNVTAGIYDLDVNKTLGTIKEATTYTPTTSDQIIDANTYLTGTQIILGDENLNADNIKSGVSIFGINGTLESGIDTSDATATGSDIASGKTAYVNGNKVVGNVSTNSTVYSRDYSTLGGNESIFSPYYKVTSDVLIRSGAQISISVPYSNFGNATAADVAAGKTFTSSAGLKVTGTASNGIDHSQYTLFSTSSASASIIDYEYSNGLYSPGIKIYAPTLSGKSIYGFHIYVYYYDYDSDENWCNILTYWNPSRTVGAEQMVLTAIDMSSGKPNSDSLEFITRDDIGDFDIATMSGNYLSIAFEPLSGSVDAEWSDLYSLERYLIKVWYK